MRDDPVDSVEVSLEEGSLETLQVRQALERLRSEQNLLGALLAGAVAALAGAGVWEGVTVLTGFRIGWMAVGVGFLVGVAVRSQGRGIDRIFGAIGAALSLVGCAVGNLLAVCALLSKELSIPYLDILRNLSADGVGELMAATFDPIDVLFYGIAVYEGYHFSFRRVTAGELGLPADQGG